MLMNTLRNYNWTQRFRVRARRAEPEAGRQRFPQAVYWRRRLVALAVALAVLSLIAWAFFGALGLSLSPSAAPSAAGRTSHGRSGQGSAGQGSSGQGGAPAGGSPSPAAASSGTARRGHRSSVQTCARGSVVLSLLATQSDYSGRQFPQFTIDVVSTAGATCTLNVGARHIALVIRSGSDRVWSSADCPRGSGSLISDLERGVPTTLPITWNRQTSAPGCSGPSTGLPAGVYAATVTDGGLASNTVTFRLS
jgi:hypothetical protein